MDKVKVIIIDDEANARLLIKKYLESSTLFEIVGEAENGFEGALLIRQLNPDLVFLDVQMPKLNGFEMLEVLDKIPPIIFSTAYDEFALKAFELGAIDYLLKPYSQTRFNKAIEKIRMKSVEDLADNKKLKEMMEYVREGQEVINRIAVKTNNNINILLTQNIYHIEAQDDYVFIYTNTGDRFIKDLTMKYLDEHLDAKEFVRVHRSHIVRMDQIAKIENIERESHILIMKNNVQIPASKNGYKALKDVLNL